MFHVVAALALICVIAVVIFGLGWLFGSFSCLYDDFFESEGTGSTSRLSVVLLVIIVVCGGLLLLLT